MVLGPIDWIIVATLVVSMLIGLLRGLVREVFSVVGWVTGVLLAIRYAAPIGTALPLDESLAAGKVALAAVLIVLTVVIVAGVIGWLVRKLLSAVKLSAADRAMGTVFGLGRALLIVFAVVVFMGRTEAAQQPLWRESVLLAYAESAVRFAAPWLPEPLRRYAPG